VQPNIGLVVTDRRQRPMRFRPVFPERRWPEGLDRWFGFLEGLER
jgi:hypothetical protein